MVGILLIVRFIANNRDRYLVDVGDLEVVK